MPALRNVVLFALGVLVMAGTAGADTLPASVRACIGEADATRRLACYDREVARLIAPADTFGPPAAGAPGAPPAPAASSASPAAPAAAAAPGTPPAAATLAAAPAPSVPPAAPPASALSPSGSSRPAVPHAGPPRHLTAKVSAVHQSNDDLIVTLDNGDVWEQSAPATSQLNLRPGDVVQVDREAGSWFLSNRYGNNIQVRLRQP